MRLRSFPGDLKALRAFAFDLQGQKAPPGRGGVNLEWPLACVEFSTTSVHSSTVGLAPRRLSRYCSASLHSLQRFRYSMEAARPTDGIRICGRQDLSHPSPLAAGSEVHGTEMPGEGLPNSMTRMIIISIIDDNKCNNLVCLDRG